MATIEVTHEAEIWDWPLQAHEGVVKIINTEDKFEVGLDAQYFSPKEIEVKVCGRDLLVHCRHESRPDELGSISREVHRAYKLPSDVDVTSIKSHLTNRGVLNITAKKMGK